MNAFLDYLVKDQRRSYFFLLFLSLFFFIGLGRVHLFDWDEINFAESAREMIESGNYLRVQINYLPFWEKPPFFFWLQVLSMKVFGINDFAARFPNALFGFIYLLTFYKIGKKHFDTKFGLIWALVFFGSLLPHIYFKSGIIDPVFNYFIFMSVYFMMIVIGEDHEKKFSFALLSGIFSGLSIITKGPVGFLLLALTFIVYIVWKKFRVFPKLKYILIFIAGLFIIISIWLFIEIYQNGFNVLSQFIAYQIELFNSPVAGHAQPFYYHFVVVFLGCFPMSVFALPILIENNERLPFDIQKWMKSLFWVVMILFSITTTKIVHYSSMAYAPLSFMAAMYLYKINYEQVKLKRFASVIFLIIGIIVGLLITALPLLLKNKDILYPLINDQFAVDSLKTDIYWSGFEILAGIIFLAGTVFAFIYLKRGLIQRAILTCIFANALMLTFVLVFILPKIEAFTQGPAIRFYQSLEDKDCYIESFDFKSYAQYYYSRTKPLDSNSALEKSKNQFLLDQNVNHYFQLTSDEKFLFDQNKFHWMMYDSIDKDVYFVSKSTNQALDTVPDFKLIGKEGGFRFYKRKSKK